MSNKENNPIQEIYLPPATSETIKKETMKMAYNSGAYTFASRNCIELPERVGYAKNSGILNKEDDEYMNGIFRDVNGEEIIGKPSLESLTKKSGRNTYTRTNGINADMTRRYGLSGYLLSKPIPIQTGGGLKRQTSMIF